MNIKNSEPNNTIIPECPEYEPIQAVGHLASEYGAGDQITDYAIMDNEGGEPGCDTCIHFNHRNCDAFNRKN